ncbi:unnamed protein product [Camellia sinensis]
MLNFAKDYDHLPLIAKVEVFECALQNSERNDLARVFWLKSRTSKNGLDRRTNYTRSLAVISMVSFFFSYYLDFFLKTSRIRLYMFPQNQHNMAPMYDLICQPFML